jgi:hypothetical protein
MSAPSAISNARQILVGAGTAATPVVLGTGRLNQAAFIANAGEVGIFTPEGLRIVETGAGVVAGVSVAAVAGMDFVTALSRGAALPPLVSDKIVGTSVTLSGRDAGAAATEQVTAVGYNGTSGLIADVATYAGELYKVTVLVHQFLSGTDSEHLKAGYYQSQLTDGQAEIALGMAASVIKNFSREVSNSNGDKPVKAKAVCNAAGALVIGAANATISKGTSALSMNAVITGAVVGDYIRLSETAGGIGLASPVFKILSIAGSVYTLDREYQGATMAALVVAANVFLITAAAGAAGNWGVVLTGTPLPFNRSKKRYAKCRFDVSLSESFGSTVAANTANASEGEGTFEAISQLENFLSRFMGESYEMGQPFIDNIDSDLQAVSTVAGGFYSLMALNFSDTQVVSFQNEISPKELLIAFPATATARTYARYATANSLGKVIEDIVPAAALIDGDMDV